LSPVFCGAVEVKAILLMPYPIGLINPAMGSAYPSDPHGEKVVDQTIFCMHYSTALDLSD